LILHFFDRNATLNQFNYDFNLISEQDLVDVENKLNNRPRKRLGFCTPNQVYLQHIKNMDKVAFIT